MKSIITLAIVLLCSSFGFAQYDGYYGKKNIIEINNGFRFPLFSLFSDFSGNGSYYMSQKGSTRLKRSHNYFDYSFRTSFMHASKENSGVGFEYSMELGSIAGPDYSMNDWPNFEDVYYEKLKTRTHLFIPKLEFTYTNSILPIGLSHQLGLGVGLTKIVEDTYSYASVSGNNYISQGESIMITGTNSKVVNNDFTSRALILLYAIHVKVPVSKFFTVNYGFRYNLNLPLGYSTGSSMGYTMHSSEAHSKISKMRFRSLISFNLGMGFVF